MSTRHPLSSMKKWSFLFFLLIFFGGLATAPSGFAGCEYLSNDFSTAEGLTANQSTGTWSRTISGMLDVEDISEGYLTRAETDFFPGGYFSVDVEVSILATSDQYDAVGLYVRNSPPADAMDLLLFGIEGEDGVSYDTDGIAVLYYPVRGEVKFLIRDVVNGEYVMSQPFHAVSGTVSSIGISMMPNGAVIRVNGHDTNFRVNADFSIFGPDAINTLRLVAKGSGLHARFDNVCAAPYEVGDFAPGSAMSIPSGQEVLTTSPAASPVTSIDPGSANPFGFGSAASGGTTLSLTAGISGLSAPADLYAGIQVGAEIYLFDANNGIHPVSTDGLVKWRSNTTGGLNNVRLLPDIDMSGLSGIPFNFYFLMTPAGRLDSYRLWITQLVIAGNGGGGSGGGGGGSSTVTDHAMEQEIKQNIDLIFGITSGFSGGLNEVMSLFKDESVVTISPDLNAVIGAVFNGAPVPDMTITANFGSGHTMASGSVMRGSAQVVLSNIQFSNTVMGADFSAMFNNVTKDNAPFANGRLSGKILLYPIAGSDDKANVTGQVNLSSLTVSGQPVSGTIGISGTLEHLDLGFLFSPSDDSSDLLSNLLKTTGDITLSLSNFNSGAYTVNSGTVHIVSTQSGHATISTDLQTSQGPVVLNMTSTASTTGAAISTTAPGAAGPYTLSINNVTLDQNACANYPTAGTMSFTSHSTGKIGVVSFNGSCNGTYGYGER